MFASFNSRSFRDGLTGEPLVTESLTRDSAITTKPSRPKRVQTRRACESCRSARIKCDNGVPCNNCRLRSEQCSNSSRIDARNSSSGAAKEIDRLKAQVKRLELELEQHRKGESPHDSTKDKPATSSPSTVGLPDYQPGNTNPWIGAWTNCMPDHQRQLFGPMSSFYFIGRLVKFLGTVVQPVKETDIHPISASKIYTSPSDRTAMNNGTSSATAHDLGDGKEIMSRAVEQQYLDLFWQTYHPLVPIIHETSFLKHYDSLWSPDSRVRRPCPLVDIVVALCLQHGKSFLPQDPAKNIGLVPTTDPTIAGCVLYRRSQALLAAELERPSISTLQCYIYSAIYLQNASFYNMSHNTAAVAVRTAFTMGLHQNPPASLSSADQELRKRIWWCLFAVETKACLNFGRPWLINVNEISCQLPSDDEVSAKAAGDNFTGINMEASTWLSYQVHVVKMIFACQAIHTSLLDQASQIQATNLEGTPYTSPPSLETLSRHLCKIVCRLTVDWVSEVPRSLQLQLPAGETPTEDQFPTLRVSPSIANKSDPIWLQRQRLMLNLRYHEFLTAIYRPFIRFSSDTPTSNFPSTPYSDSHATASVNHALTVTIILHAMLTQDNLLAGYHELYRFQWNAILSLVGFCFAYPVNPTTPPAKKGLEQALEVLDAMGKMWAVARNAGGVVRSLLRSLDRLIGTFSGEDFSHDSGEDRSYSNEEGYNSTSGSNHMSNGLEEGGIGLEDFDFEMLMAEGGLSTEFWPDFINGGF